MGRSGEKNPSDISSAAGVRDYGDSMYFHVVTDWIIVFFGPIPPMVNLKHVWVISLGPLFRLYCLLFRTERESESRYMSLRCRFESGILLWVG